MGDDELYELAEEPPTKAVPAASVQVGAGADVPRPVSPIRPLAYQTPQAIGTTEPERTFEDRLMHLHAPLAMIGGGLVIEAVALWFQSDPMRPFISGMRGMGLRLILGNAAMLVAIWIASRVRHFSLGPLPLAMLKLCAISVAPGAVMTLLYPMSLLIPVLGGLAVGILGFCLHFALVGMFFELDQDDTWYCVVLMFLINIGMAIGLVSLGW